MKKLLLLSIALLPALINAQSFEKAMVYYENDQDSLALAEFLKCEPVYQQKYGSNDTVFYTKILKNIGDLHHTFSLNDTALYYLSKSERIYQKVGIDNMSYAELLNYKGRVYFEISKYEDAINALEISLRVYKNLKLEQSEKYANLMIDFGEVYSENGDGLKALEYYNLSIKILKDLNLEYSETSAIALNGIAITYFWAEYYDHSLEYTLKAKAIYEKIELMETNNYAVTINTVGMVYDKLGNYDKALKFYLRSSYIDKINGLENTLGYAALLNNIGLTYINLEKFNHAHTNLIHSSEILIRLGLGNTRSYAIVTRNIGDANYEQGNLLQALNYYKESASIDVEIGMKESSIIQNIAELSFKLGNYTEALDYIHRYYEMVKNKVLSSQGIIHASEQLKENNQRIEIICNWFDYNRSYPKSFAISNYNAYLLLRSITNANYFDITSDLYQHNNPDVKQHLQTYKDCKRQLYNYYVQNSNIDSADLSDLYFNLYQAEEYLNIHTNIRREKQVLTDGFSIVEQALKENEASIDFIQSTLNDSIGKQYNALLVRSGYSSPVILKSIRAKELDNIKRKISNSLFVSGSITDSIKQTYMSSISKELYSLIWQNVDTLLKGVQKVYISPIGGLYNIAFGALPISDTQSLSDKYEIEYVSSASQIVVKPEPLFFSDSTSIALFGDMDYNMDTTLIKDQLMAYAETRGDDKVNMELGGSWNALHNEFEIKSIANLFIANNAAASNYTKNQAIEEAFLNLDGKAPQIIHLSTHAKYNALEEKQDVLSDSVWYETSENPLLRSFLVMSGANSLRKIKDDQLNDGLLTAYEVANMDLTDTRLATLAACQTGLGDIGNYEGVQGLRHAFKIAGVDYLMVSLWSVPDAQTSEFMIGFYNNFVSHKMEVREAFNAAQKTMKAKYSDNPFYWAGFVLVY